MYSSRLPLKNPLTRNQNENIGKPISLEKNQYELGNEVTKVRIPRVYILDIYKLNVETVCVNLTNIWKLFDNFIYKICLCAVALS